MGLESLCRNISILKLSKCPLVDDSGVTGIVEYAGGDPRLHVTKQSAVSIHYIHHTQKEVFPKKRTSSTSHPPRLTPRTFCAPYEKLGLNARATGRRPMRARRTADENISRSDYGEGMEWRRKKKVPKPSTTLDECHPL